MRYSDIYDIDIVYNISVNNSGYNIVNIVIRYYY